MAEEINPWIKRAVTLATFICTLLFAQQAAQITWLIIEDHSIILPAPAQNNKQSQQQTDNYTIEQYHLFGTASEKPVETKTVANVDAPTTKLRLELKGVFTAETQATSSAIIAEKGRGGDYFKVGEKVQGRTKLAAVYPEKVILDTNGKMETLEFEESKGVSIKANKPTENKRNKNNERSQKAQKRLSKSRNPKDFVNLAKELLNNDAKAAVSSMGLEPVAKDSSSGYRVGSSATMLLSIGMKVGDIILSVNDQPVGNIAQDQMLLDEVTSSGNAKVEIQRGSRRLVINHSL